MAMSSTPGAACTAVVLAGGFGSRIRHLLGSLPKPLAPVCGKPFLHWVVEYLQRQGAARIVLLTHYEARQVDCFAASVTRPGLIVESLREEQHQGTGGAAIEAIRALPDLAETFVLLNGDSLVIADLAPAFQQVARGSAGAILGVRVPDASLFGTLEVDGAGHLLRFSEKRPGRGTVNAGVYVLRKAALRLYDSGTRPLSIETGVFPAMLAAGEDIRVVETDAPFIDIGTEATLSLAENFVATHLAAYPRPPQRLGPGP